MDIMELFVGEMRIDLCRGNVRVAQKRLHRTEVGAVYEKIGREAVAEFVRVDRFRDAGLAGARTSPRAPRTAA